MIRFLFLSLLVLYSEISISAPYRLAFGSCNKQEGDQEIWLDLVQAKPAMYMWIGDAVYANAVDAKQLESSYLKLFNHPNYVKMRTSIPVIGVWDDHDYGRNNSGAENPIKKQSQQIFLNFLGEQLASARRHQEGVYASYDVVHEGLKIKMILLDTRYFRGKPFQKNSEFLGEAQWAWLGEVLDHSKADLHLIVSGISVLSGRLPRSEQWENFPADMTRLFSAIQKRKTKNVVFLTGDRHFAGVIERKVNGVPYVELMSSGINHDVVKGAPRAVMHGIYKGKAWFDKHIGILDISKNEREIEIQFRNLSIGQVMRDRYALKLPL
ncbi:MAG: alkaline phosphatase family protein [Bdellovibrionales bacterium]|nr:alkaline phosphatase family protein [Bdellovibrionales bacterium]